MHLDHYAFGDAHPRAGQEPEVERVLIALDRASKGEGSALCIDGPPKSGKTGLLAAALDSVEGTVLRVDGFEVESRLAAAGLSRISGYVSHPSTGVLAHVHADGPLMTGLSLLERLRDLSEEQLVVLAGDDAHWLDTFTLEVLGIIGRRIERDRIAVVLAGEPSADFDRCMVGIDRITLEPPPRAVSAADNPANRRKAHIRLLGRFEVRVGDVVVSLGDGAPATLLKAVALRAQAPAEEVEEILWPGAEPGLGRARMRNVIHRIRNACGPLVERDGRTLRLATGVEVDVHAFEECSLKAIAALEAGTPDARKSAWEALSLYTGELLPVDRHADWTAVARERLSRLYSSLFDHLEIDASERGDTAEALRVIERAIELDPYDEARYIRGARLLVERGSTGPAASMLRSAQVSMEGTGMDPSRALSDVLKKLSG